jgi:hypothetical protein
MRTWLQAQIDLFVASARPPELSGADRQRALTLLRALLTEAMTKPAAMTATSTDKEVADE